MSNWTEKIQTSIKLRREWESRFKCQKLEEYYYGFQWKNKNRLDPVPYQPYQINLFDSTIKIKLAGMLFQKPSFVLSPKPGVSGWDMESAIRSSQIKQDTLNTIVGNKNLKFTQQLKRAAVDSFFRFGIIEVGYAQDWRNPQKLDPVMKSDLADEYKDVSVEEDSIKENRPLPTSERIYVKRIKAARFLVSNSDAEDLEDFEWCGYEDHFYTNVLMNLEGIKWPKNFGGADLISGQFNPSGQVGQEYTPGDIDMYKERSGRAVSKVYHIFNNTEGKRCLYLDGYMDEPLWEEEYDHLNLIDLRWSEMLSGFYPVPPAFQWLSPQDEINEAREQTRSYRRRFTRKFQFVDGQVEPEEVEKFTDSGDGALIKVKQLNAIAAIDNPEMGQTSENALLLAKDDFNTASSTSTEARGQEADRQTATAAKITNARASIRENSEQMDFSVFGADVGREILVQAQTKMQLPLWVKFTTNPDAPDLQQEIQTNSASYKQITHQDLSDGYDYEIDVDITNGTPAAMEQSETAFIKFLSYLQQFPAVAMDPGLIRELAYRVGYRNEQIIAKMQKVAIASTMAKAQQIAGVSMTPDSGTGANPNNTTQAHGVMPQLPQLSNGTLQ